MTALTTKEFITWANRLANLPWPMTLEEFTTTATKDFGWNLGDGGKHFIATFSERAEYVMFSVNDENEIDDVLFFIARGDSDERGNVISLNDLFVAYTSAGTEAWGKVAKKKWGKSHRLHGGPGIARSWSWSAAQKLFCSPSTPRKGLVTTSKDRPEMT